MRNKQWRKDLVKRYWINNSDDSGQDDVNNNEFKLKDEFERWGWVACWTAQGLDPRACDYDHLHKRRCLASQPNSCA